MVRPPICGRFRADSTLLFVNESTATEELEGRQCCRFRETGLTLRQSFDFLDFGPSIQAQKRWRHQRGSLSSLLEPTYALLRCWQETELFSFNAVDWQIANGSPPLSVRQICAASIQKHRNMGEPAGILNLNEAKSGVQVSLRRSLGCLRQIEAVPILAAYTSVARNHVTLVKLRKCDGGILESTYSLLLLFATFDLMTCD